MASVWMRAAKASSYSRLLLRASRTGLVLPRQVHLSAVRYFPAAAASTKVEDALNPVEDASNPVEGASEFDAPVEVEDVPSPSPSYEKTEKKTDKKLTEKLHSAIEGDLPEFSSLKGKISYDVLKAITTTPMKLTHMSPVQAAVLPMLPDLVRPPTTESESAEEDTKKGPRDLLVKARTGTGKTLAFLVPAIESRLRAIEAHAKQAVADAGLKTDKQLEGRARRLFSRQHAGALIITPTRELASQIAEEAIKLTTHNDLEVRVFVGGVGKRNQMREWMRGRRDIVVGTPGRIRDLLENEPEVAQGLSKAKMLILDEADTLLEMGFREDIEAITSALPAPPERQTFLFSATVSRPIQQVARATLDRNHAFINCVTDDAPPVHAHVPQYHTVVQSADKQIPHLLRLLAHDQLINPGKSKSIVFLPTTKLTQLFSTMLRELADGTLPFGRNTRVYEMHSKRTQETRTRTSDQFRKDRSPASVLVTSDISARGIDYPGVTRVIQVGIPGSPEQYVHRVGRTGRGLDTTGRADLVLLPWEIGFVTWQLTDIPLKPLTAAELKNQVTEAIAGHDENAKRPYAPVHERLEERVSQLLPELDEEAIRECFMAGLGYYLSRSGDLRVQKNVIVSGLKDWTTGALGLPTPPYVSETFLERMGAQDQRKRQNRQPRERTNRWEGRGRQSTRDAPKEHEHRFGVKDLDRGDYQERIGERPPRRDGDTPFVTKKRYNDEDGGGERRSFSKYGGDRERRSSRYGEDKGEDRRSSRYGEDKGEDRRSSGSRYGGDKRPSDRERW